MSYKNILVALDYGKDAASVLNKAIELSKLYSANLHVMHVVEPVNLTGPYDLSPIIPLELEQQMIERARSYLTQLLKECHLDDIAPTIAVGSIKSEIFAAAEKSSIDLIMLGTHGRHGVGLLLGSTATAVLHGTPCDVLAVRIQN